jgi:hypothetical protein
VLLQASSRAFVLCAHAGGGNDNVFTGNYIHDVCYEVSDSGAWYAGNSWTQRGNVVAHNTFINIRRTEAIFMGDPHVQAIYCDDQLSGTAILYNTIVNAQVGVLLGGGRDSQIVGNVFHQCDTAVTFDDRGLSWEAAICTYNSTYTGELVQGMFNVNYTQPPYATAYPEMTRTLSNYPCTPVNVTIADNTYCQLSGQFLSATPDQIAAWFDSAYNNTQQC